MNSIIIYSTTDGQTKKICEAIKENSLNKESIDISTLKEAFNKKLENYDKIIIGASIRYGRHSPMIYKFIQMNKDILERKKNAFFSVNVVARKLDKNTPDTNPYIKKFLKKTSWKPNKLGVFAGKIDYPNLTFVNRHVIRLIMFLTNGPTNIDKTYEFTDWQSVKRFSNELDI
tara:strand:+ start:69 stop:587 length:519 start_codon:yes stop_codon:yes gene_type:complete